MVFFLGGSLMKRQLRVRVFAVLVGVAFAALMSHASVARAQVQYRWDNGAFTERFNNSEGTETEDNWVANAFQVVDGGTHIVSIEFPIGETYTDLTVDAVIYQGFDLRDPTAGGGLVRLSTTETTITATQGSLVTITLETPPSMAASIPWFTSPRAQARRSSARTRRMVPRRVGFARSGRVFRPL